MSQVSVFTDLILRDKSAEGISSFEASVAAMKQRIEAQDVQVGLVGMDGVTPTFEQIKTDIAADDIQVPLIAMDGVTSTIEQIRAEAAANPVVVPVEGQNEGTDGDDDDGEGDEGGGGGGGRGSGMMGRILAGIFARDEVRDAIKGIELEKEFGTGAGDGTDPTAKFKDQMKALKAELKGLDEQFSGVSGWMRENAAENAQDPNQPRGPHLKPSDVEAALNVPAEKRTDRQNYLASEATKDQLTEGIDKKIADSEAQDNKSKLLVRSRQNREAEMDEMQAATDESNEPDQSPVAKQIREIQRRLAKQKKDLQAMLELPASEGLNGYEREGFLTPDAQKKFVSQATTMAEKEANAKIATIEQQKDFKEQAEADKQTTEEKKKAATANAHLAEEAAKAAKIAAVRREAEEANAKANELRAQGDPLGAQLVSITEQNARDFANAPADPASQKAVAELAKSRIDKLLAEIQHDETRASTPTIGRSSTRGGTTSLDEYSRRVLEGGMGGFELKSSHAPQAMEGDLVSVSQAARAAAKALDDIARVASGGIGSSHVPGLGGLFANMSNMHNPTADAISASMGTSAFAGGDKAAVKMGENNQKFGVVVQEFKTLIEDAQRMLGKNNHQLLNLG